MDKETIKQSLPLAELVERYGFRINRQGFINCPFHKADDSPSLRIYPKTNSFYCFACGVSGDIFTFYQKMQGCDFKTAFRDLGGTYQQKQSFSSYLRMKALSQHKSEQTKQQQAENDFFKLLTYAMALCTLVDDACEVFSDNWCYIVNHRDWLNYCYELKYFEGKEVPAADVFRVCKQIRQRFFAIE